MLSADSAPGSERLLGERVHSTGDFNHNSVGRTVSTLSAMSGDSAADSSGSDVEAAAEVRILVIASGDASSTLGFMCGSYCRHLE